MAKTAEAKTWEVFLSDETGSFITIRYDCSHCGEYQCKNIFTTCNVDFGYDFTVYDTCDDCGKKVNVNCDV